MDLDDEREIFSELEGDRLVPRMPKYAPRPEPEQRKSFVSVISGWFLKKKKWLIDRNWSWGWIRSVWVKLLAIWIAYFFIKGMEKDGQLVLGIAIVFVVMRIFVLHSAAIFHFLGMPEYEVKFVMREKKK